jgi:hypothetical protein
MFNERVIAQQLQVEILRAATTRRLQGKVNKWLSEHSNSHLYGLKYKIRDSATMPYTMAILYKKG